MSIRVLLVCCLALMAVPWGCETAPVASEQIVDAIVSPETKAQQELASTEQLTDSSEAVADVGMADVEVPAPDTHESTQPDVAAVEEQAPPEPVKEAIADKAAMACLPGPGLTVGTRVGQFLRDETLLDCDGNPVKFSDFCRGKAVWISFHHAW